MYMKSVLLCFTYLTLHVGNFGILQKKVDWSLKALQNGQMH